MPRRRPRSLQSVGRTSTRADLVDGVMLTAPAWWTWPVSARAADCSAGRLTRRSDLATPCRWRRAAAQRRRGRRRPSGSQSARALAGSRVARPSPTQVEGRGNAARGCRPQKQVRRAPERLRPCSDRPVVGRARGGPGAFRETAGAWGLRHLVGRDKTRASPVPRLRSGHARTAPIPNGVNPFHPERREPLDFVGPGRA